MPYYGSSNYKSKKAYIAARNAAVEADLDVCTNVMAYYFLMKTHREFEQPDCIVLDEVDQLFNLMQELTLETRSLGRTMVKNKTFKELTSTTFLASFLEIEALEMADKVKEATTFQQLRSRENRLAKLLMVVDSLKCEPHKYAAKVMFEPWGKKPIFVNEENKFKFFSEKGVFKVQLKPYKCLLPYCRTCSVTPS